MMLMLVTPIGAMLVAMVRQHTKTLTDRTTTPTRANLSLALRFNLYLYFFVVAVSAILSLFYFVSLVDRGLAIR